MAGSLISQGRRSPGNLPRIPGRRSRADWIDIAKGVSITLVVFGHVVGPLVPLNEALIFLRMPLFFFLAGWVLARPPLFAPLFEVPWVRNLQARRAASPVPGSVHGR